MELLNRSYEQTFDSSIFSFFKNTIELPISAQNKKYKPYLNSDRLYGIQNNLR